MRTYIEFVYNGNLYSTCPLMKTYKCNKTCIERIYGEGEINSQ